MLGHAILGAGARNLSIVLLDTDGSQGAQLSAGGIIESILELGDAVLNLVESACDGILDLIEGVSDPVEPAELLKLLLGEPS